MTIELNNVKFRSHSREEHEFETPRQANLKNRPRPRSSKKSDLQSVSTLNIKNQIVSLKDNMRYLHEENKGVIKRLINV